ncbi:MAG: hypothetical protein E7359_04100 [Clostridiales bacterium]|nr:hypothetical protein [Clostridiales bacterium]
MEKLNENENNVSVTENSSGYSVKIDVFEGPLDLLLHLIKDAKLDIQTIKLSEITGQYLEYINTLDLLNMENAAEFLEVAATLIEIKSKKILPREEEEIVDEEDPETLLKRRLEEYKLFKDASEALKEIENVNKLYKQPSKEAGEYRIVLKQMNIDNLIKAFSTLLIKTQESSVEHNERTIERERFTVEEKIFEIKSLLINCEKISFNALIDEDFTRSEVINLFLALLELLKRQYITVEQDGNYAEIQIFRNDEGEKLDE